MRQLRGSVITWIVPVGFLWQFRYNSRRSQFLARGDTSLTSRMRCLAISEFVVLTIRAFLEWFPLSLYHAMVLQGYGTRVIAYV